LHSLLSRPRDSLRISGYHNSLTSRETVNKAKDVISALCGQVDVARIQAGQADEIARQLVDLGEYGQFPVPQERPDARAALLAAGIEITESKGKVTT
jgi:hypothetical protein